MSLEGKEGSSDLGLRKSRMDFRIIKNNTIRRIKMMMMRHMFATGLVVVAGPGLPSIQYTDFFSPGQCPDSAHPASHARLPDGWES